VGWSARELAERTKVHLATVQRMEKREGPARGNVASLNAIVDALQQSGVEFISEDGRVGVVLIETNGAHDTDQPT